MNKAISFLLIIIIGFSVSLSAQSTRRPKIVSDSVFHFKNGESDKNSLLPLKLIIELESVPFDTCGYNSLYVEILLQNKTTLPILYKEEISIWDDSGFGSEQYIKSTMKIIAPNRQRKLRLNIHNSMRELFTKSGDYTIYYNDKEFKIPISIHIRYMPKACLR